MQSLSRKAVSRTGKETLKTATKTRRSVWSTVRDAVTDAFGGLTGRRKAQQNRKRATVAAAAGAVTATGAAGAYLAKRSRSGSSRPQSQPYASPEPPAEPNGATSTVATGGGSTAG